MTTILRILEAIWGAPVPVRLLIFAVCLAISTCLVYPSVFVRNIIRSLAGTPSKTVAQEDVPVPVVNIGGSMTGGNVIAAGRDLQVVVGRKGSPSAQELRQDVVVDKNISVTFSGPPPFPHYAAVRVVARELTHPEFYVRIIATGPVRDWAFEVQNFPGGMRQMIASTVYGQTLEYTEGPPGLEPGRPWILVVYSDTPIDIADVATEDKCLFNDVLY